MSSFPKAGPAPPSPLVRLWRALDERYQLSGLVEFLSHKEVPVGAHSTVWYYFGGVALFFFVVQIVTGILLLMYYQVGEKTSYESMKYLVGHVPFGWLIRSIHCWSAHLMTVAVLVHLFSVLFVKAYRKPRELTWYTGFAMLGLVLGFGFSGYLLPWNELSYFATAVGTSSVKSVPLIGPWLLRVLRGGEEVSVETLYRFFALHVCILPLVIAGFIGVHLLFVQRQGMAEPLESPGEKPRRLHGMPFFPNFALRDVLLWVACLNVLAILAVVVPFGPGIPGMEWALGDKANPLKPAYPGIKPEWYFLWIYQMLREFPAHVLGLEGPQACLILTTVLMGIAFLIPLLDRNAAKGKPSPLFTDLGVAGLLFVGFLTLKAWDIGVHVPKGQDPTADPALAATIARTAAIWTLAVGLIATAVRRFRFRHTAFAFTAAVLLQVLLNGFVHVSWLVAGAVAAAALLAYGLFRRFRTGASGAAAALLVAALAGIPGQARAEEKTAVPAPTTAAAPAGEHLAEASWPDDFRKLFLAEEKGKPVLGDKTRARFRNLPSHAQDLFISAVASGFLGTPQQLAMLLSLDLDDRKTELLLSDNCVLCHTNTDMPDEILFRIRTDRSAPSGHLDIVEMVNDVHFRRGLMCSGCHGGTPSDKEMSPEIYKRWPADDVRKKDRTWIPAFCARCHSSSDFMRDYNPGLPVDQLLKYKTSRHGQLLLEKKDSKAAQCVSCHGVHGIRGPDSPASSVYPENIPATCGHCHANAEYMKGYTLLDGKPLPTNQLALYRQSVHGIALLKKHDKGAPACNGCHGNHAALLPQTAYVSQVCRNCHSANGSLFDGSPHKKAFEAHRWPECATCHNNHLIETPSDEMLKPGPKALCTDCHEKYGKPICIETATFFYTTITGLAGQSAALDKDVDRLAERGFDVDNLRFQASSVHDALRKVRLDIHTFDRSDFLKGSQAASAAIDQLKQGTARTWQEYRYRRSGLLFATALISIFGVLLYLKIRAVDRK